MVTPRKENGSRPNLKRPRVDGATGVDDDLTEGSEGRGSSSKHADRIFFKDSQYETGSSSKAAAGDKSFVVPCKQGKQGVVGPNRPTVDAAEFDRLAQMRVKKALRQFQEELTRLADYGLGSARYKVAANCMKSNWKWVNTKEGFGNIPGVHVGDKFGYRAELCVIGLHGSYEFGIDCLIDNNGKMIARSIVDSGRYPNKWQSDDVLIYIGAGADTQDQKAVRRNLGLMNSYPSTPVRVICSFKIGKESGYVYVGLFRVDDFWTEMVEGKLVFKFLLIRLPGQPKLKLCRK